ncbi:patatin-like phospholipase family protein [Lutimonas zeaxanthinifaciens]|uniref:patatin-like phospholipase family protein n=1 Tax=Lutimonas zeaxanthinifaciens TaxID=3060215 RepID=UPI00265D256F|nr:patatin-like phospholipase family protein [Lutimonas sp. YSD2104]WKK65793.1 patatin-like phospholipase family protein [Lutimonas sp. YSD2104]
MKYFLFLLMLIFMQPVLGQEKTEPAEDLKIGLVLSGGGAKGFAHVAVLKKLEEAGIRVDYIAGTSMGAIIGGLYASGYNARELDSVLRVNDLSGLVRDDLPREVSSFYQKENDGKYAVSLPITKGKIELPSAVSKGQNAFNIFSQLTEHVHEVNDFSELDIPFFCIATNLETGEEVVMDKGFLPEAIRASGAFPGLLTPVKVDGKVLVDGGIVDNFPVEKMRNKGVDYIIGVNVSSGLKDIENIKTLPEILLQIAGFQMYNQWDDKIDESDLYIRPDLEEFTTFSFDESEEILRRGEEAMNKVEDQLKDIASRQKGEPRARSIETFKFRDDFLITDIKVKGNRNYTDQYCIKKLGLEKNERISRKDFMRGIDVLTATGNFESIFYKLISDGEGVKVEFEINENDEETYIQFGAHYDDLYKTGVLVNFTNKHLFFKNDFVSADLVIGDNIRYNIDYFYDNGFNWSFGINSRYNTFKADVVNSTLPDTRSSGSFDTGLKVPIRYLDFTTRLFLQSTIKDRWAFRVGVEHKFLNAYTDEVIDNVTNRIYFEKSHYFSAFGKVMLDTYDADYFPKKGVFLNSEYLLYGLSSDYNNNFNTFSQLYGRVGLAYSFFDKLTFHLISEAGVTIGNNDNMVLDYHLGGYNENYINTFIPFYGYGFAELNESAFLRTALTIRYEIFKKNFLSFTGNFGRLNEDIWNDGRIFEDTRSGYAAGYGVNTFIGPVELIYSWNPDNEQNHWYINVGFWF